jgi:hypothetical protein
MRQNIDGCTSCISRHQKVKSTETEAYGGEIESPDRAHSRLKPTRNQHRRIRNRRKYTRNKVRPLGTDAASPGCSEIEKDPPTAQIDARTNASFTLPFYNSEGGHTESSSVRTSGWIYAFQPRYKTDRKTRKHTQYTNKHIATCCSKTDVRERLNVN